MDKDNYDQAATVFSPDGRVYQVEYAREAIKRGGLAMAMVFDRGIVFSIVKTIHSSLIEEDDLEKFYLVTPQVGAAASGLIADARVLVDLMRDISQQEKRKYGEDVDIRSLILRISRINEIYTRYEGVRPFGAALVIGGFDDKGFHLYETDPSGVFQERTATAIGNGADLATSILESKYKRGLDKNTAILLTCEIIKETREGDTDTSNGFEGIELYILSRSGVEKKDVEKEQDLMDLIGGAAPKKEKKKGRKGPADGAGSGEVREFLEKIPRIGPSAIDSITENFPTMGDLKKASIDDLLKLKGIGKATAERIIKALENDR
ncbi:MAG: archaeal proteasome endopeptidase complex subunit alpha [Thermoplasmatota archaeon]